MFGDKLIDFLLEFIGFFKFWRVIPINKIGVKLRFGRRPRLLKPGFHLVLPFEMDDVKTCIVEPEQYSTTAVHFTTSDSKTVSACPTIKYKITNPVAWLYEANDAATNLHEIVRLATSQILSDCAWDECTRKSVWTKIKNKIIDKTNDLGIKIDDFGLIDLVITRIYITSLNQ